MSLKEALKLFSSNSRGPVHEDRRLQIEEVNEWQTHKPRTPNKPKLCQNEPDTSPNQLKVGDKVLLDVADPHIVTTTPNEEIPLMILSIFPFGTVEVSYPKFSTFKGMRSINSSNHHDHTMERNTGVELEHTGVGEANKARHSRVNSHALGTRACTMSSSRGKKAVVHASNKRKGASSSAGPTAEIRHPLLQFPQGPQEELFQILWA
ncbi:hypothetical protein GOBAR_AA32461 [Gossypium barbadense]|uniref:Uncharacterized protein n=1 Tax=Gossypium barbadense TaxID=3634 RepID=A0A2P5WAY8_GOSBA|nr:hypothetical protein GOBAR_AA32461 [Gossypium barbadense]